MDSRQSLINNRKTNKKVGHEQIAKKETIMFHRNIQINDNLVNQLLQVKRVQQRDYLALVVYLPIVSDMKFAFCPLNRYKTFLNLNIKSVNY